MPILLLILTIVVSIALAAYILHAPNIPHWLRILVYIALALMVCVAIAMGIYTVAAIFAHI